MYAVAVAYFIFSLLYVFGGNVAYIDSAIGYNFFVYVLCVGRTAQVMVDYAIIPMDRFYFQLPVAIHGLLFL